METKLLDAALSYARRGWYIFPCHEKPFVCVDGKVLKEKSPRTPNGFYNATTDTGQITAWWRKFPSALIGLDCERSAVLVVDIDNKHGKNGFPEWARLGIDDHGAIIQHTPSGGLHVIFKNSTGIKPPKELGPGLEIKGSGGYIILSPSVILVGEFPGEYKIREGSPKEPGEIPPALALLLTQPEQPKRETSPSLPYSSASPDKVSWAEGLLRRLDPWRCDDYQEWVKVGMTLQELNSDGLRLWEAWSKSSPKFKPGECEEKWGTFKSNGLTLGSLFEWANQDHPLSGDGYGNDTPIIPDCPPAWDNIQGGENVNRAPARKRWSVTELLDTEFPEPKWAIPGLIPEGLTILAGRPKVGKSWLLLQAAISVGCGGMFFGQRVERGNVLFVALEDGPRRLQDRIKKMRIPREALITFERSWRPLHKGGLDDLVIELEAVDYRLVIFDTLTRSFPGLSQTQNPEIIGKVIDDIQSLAINRNISIAFSDHTRKPNALDSDPVDDVMNSTEKVKSADCILALYKVKGKFNLKGRGRDVEEIDYSLRWDPVTWCWQNEGSAGELAMTEQQTKVLEALQLLGKSQCNDIARAINMDRGNTHARLEALCSAGKVHKEALGRNVYYELL
jgi:hypothetical protein